MAGEHSFEPFQATAADSDFLSHSGKWSRLTLNVARGEGAHYFHLLTRHGDQVASTSHESDQAGETQYLDKQFRSGFHAYKGVARKKGCFHKLCAVTPPPCFDARGRKGLEAFVAQSHIHLFFALIARLQRIPHRARGSCLFMMNGVVNL